MARALLLRALRALLTAWLIASAVFLLSRGLAGGSPQLLPDEQTAAFGHLATAEAQFRTRLGLQQPLFYCRLLPLQWYGTSNQYHTWLLELGRGQLGNSFRDGGAVTGHLRQALGVTLPLAGSALLLAATLALVLAPWAARHPGWYRRLVPAAYLFDTLPLFVVALLLLSLLANPDALPLFPAFGLPAEASGSPSTQAYHLVLPVLTLTLSALPALFIPFVAALRSHWQQPYVATARAKGAPLARISWQHVLPNAAPVFITRLSDLMPGVVAGTVVVEVVFALPGMGRLLAEAAAARDLPVLVGGVLLIAAVRLLGWLLADALNTWLDPRFSWS